MQYFDSTFVPGRTVIKKNQYIESLKSWRPSPFQYLVSSVLAASFTCGVIIGIMSLSSDTVDQERVKAMNARYHLVTGSNS